VAATANTLPTKAAAYYSFWSQFSIPTYEENSVEDGEFSPGFPRLTYEFGDDAFSDYGLSLTASLWYRSSSWVEANAKAAEISAVIGRGGVQFPCIGGNCWITRGSPWALRMGDENDDMIKRIVFNVTVRWNTPT
jgi:hypothetical protein